MNTDSIRLFISSSQQQVIGLWFSAANLTFEKKKGAGK